MAMAKVDMEDLTGGLEAYKDEIESLVKNRTGSVKIKKILEEKYGTKISFRALQRLRAKLDVKSPKLSHFKEEMLQWKSDGLGTGEIIEKIFDICGYRFGWPSVYTQINNWNESMADTINSELNEVNVRAPMPQRRKYNLDPFQEDFLGWQNDGLDIQTMLKEFTKKYSFFTSENNLKKFLQLWKSMWREMGVGADPKALPMDQRTTTDIMSMEILIKAAYQADFPYAPNTLLDLEVWQRNLVAAACYDRRVQGLLVKEFYQPGHHWSATRSFDPLWVLGIQLPGSYCFERVDTTAKIMGVVESLTPVVLKEVRANLEAWLEDAISSERALHSQDTLQRALSVYPATTPPMCVVKLLRLVRMDMDQTTTEIQLARAVADIKDSHGPAVFELVKFMSRAKLDGSLIQSYSAVVSEQLGTWLSPETKLSTLPPLTTSDMKAFEKSQVHDLGLKDDGMSDMNPGEDLPRAKSGEYPRFDQSDTDDNPADKWNNQKQAGKSDVSDDIGTAGPNNDDDTGHHDKDIKRIAPRRRHEDTYHGSRYFMLQRILGKQVVRNITSLPSVFKDWHTPTTGALQGYSPARFGFSSWEPDRMAFVHTVVTTNPKGLTSDEDICLQSIRHGIELETEEAKSDFGRDEVFGESVQYLKEIVKSQTSKEKDSYEAICKRMCACISRPAGAEDLEDNIIFFSAVARDDNWFHVRRLLQMLCCRYSLEESLCRAFEVQLMKLLAAIEGGSTEAILWLVPLEGCLEMISRLVRDSGRVSGLLSQKELLMQDRLLGELVTFVHAVALNSVALRSVLTASEIRISTSIYGGYQTIREPSTLQKWYSALYTVDPRCSFPPCLRLLPHPGTVKSDEVQKSFSVGVKDGRSGCRSTRAFISERKVIHPCLVMWLRSYEVEPALLNVFLFYAGLYHVDSSCKAKRGKRLQNF